MDISKIQSYIFEKLKENGNVSYSNIINFFNNRYTLYEIYKL